MRHSQQSLIQVLECIELLKRVDDFFVLPLHELFLLVPVIDIWQGHGAYRKVAWRE